jgi:hypothetical protein
MHEEADPSRIESSSSNHRDAEGEKWICGDTSGLTTHASSRSADIKIPIPTSRSPDTTRYLHLLTLRAIFRRADHSVQISPCTRAVDVRTLLMPRPMLARRINSDKRYNPVSAQTRYPSPVIQFHRPWSWLSLVGSGRASTVARAALRARFPTLNGILQLPCPQIMHTVAPFSCSLPVGVLSIATHQPWPLPAREPDFRRGLLLTLGILRILKAEPKLLPICDVAPERLRLMYSQKGTGVHLLRSLLLDLFMPITNHHGKPGVNLSRYLLVCYMFHICRHP